MSDLKCHAEVRGPCARFGRRWRVYLVYELAERDFREDSYVGSYWTRGGARFMAEWVLSEMDAPLVPSPIVERVP